MTIKEVIAEIEQVRNRRLRFPNSGYPTTAQIIRWHDTLIQMSAKMDNLSRAASAVRVLPAQMALDAKEAIGYDTFGSHDYDDVKDALRIYIGILKGR